MLRRSFTVARIANRSRDLSKRASRSTRLRLKLSLCASGVPDPCGVCGLLCPQDVDELCSALGRIAA